MAELSKTFEFPALIKTDRDRHDCGQRVQQKLIEQFNAFRPKDRADFLAFRADWRARMLPVARAIIAARAKLFPVVELGKPDPAYQAKILARPDTKWDSALADNTILVPSRIAAAELDPLEDFTTYVEVDPPTGVITVAANTLTFTAMNDIVDRYVYKDFGAGHFVNFTWTFAGQLTSASAANTGAVGPSTATEIDDIYNNTDAAGAMFWSGAGAAVTLYVYHYKVAVIQASDSYVGVQNTPYFFTYWRTGSSVVCEIYSAATRLPIELLDTLNMDDDGTARQYCFGVSDRYAGSGRTVTGWWADLDIGEGIVVLRRRIEGY